MRHMCGCPLWGKDASDEMNWGMVSLFPTLLDYKSIMLTKEKKTNKQGKCTENKKNHRDLEKDQTEFLELKGIS